MAADAKGRVEVQLRRLAGPDQRGHVLCSGAGGGQGAGGAMPVAGPKTAAARCFPMRWCLAAWLQWSLGSSFA